MPRAIWIRRWGLTPLLLLVAAVMANEDAAGAWRVGAARVEITPPLPIWLHGYAARRQEAQSVAQPLHARALAIGQGDAPPAILIAVENLGVSAATTQHVAQRLEQMFGIPAERVALCATHTHNGPMLPDVAVTLYGRPFPPAEQARIDAYGEALQARLVEVAGQAIQQRRPASLGWLTGQVDFAKNRRPQGGPVDHRLPTLIARDAQGQIIALLATYACHCTTLGPDFNQIHGDWAGCAATYLESQHPDCVALITIGCGADANPNPRMELPLAEQHGLALAQEVQRLVAAGATQEITQPLECRAGTVELPFDSIPDRASWEERARQEGVVGYRATRQLGRMDAEGRLPDALTYHLAAWWFGDQLAMAFLAGEVVVDYGLRAAREWDADRVWVHAYALDAPCYIPSRRVLQEGGYEAEGAMLYYNQPAALAPECEDLIFQRLRQMLPPGFANAP